MRDWTGRHVKRPWAAIGSAVFFALAPGTVAGLVPWWLTGWHVGAHWWPPVRLAGVLLILAGAAGIVPAFARFVVEGLGTPAPVAPPTRLVVGGVYRFVRNPMYVAVTSAIAGQALLLGRVSLLWYALGVAAAMVAFVRWYEEPRLRATFGAEYDTYRRNVPGWLPKWRPWRGPA